MGEDRPEPGRPTAAAPSRGGLLAAALVVALLGLAVPAPGSAAEREPRIANGVTTTDRPTTGALLLGDPAVQVCSGTLVGCRTFLTAAHCVCDEDGPTCDPDESSYEVFLQHAGRFPVAQITPHPDFVDFPSAANDVAVVTLTTAVEGIEPTPLASTPPPFGTSGTLVGFGNLDDAPPTGSGIKREGTVTTTSCAPSGAPESQYLCWDPEPPFGPPGTDSNSCPGDSGGPLFVLEAGETVVAGAVSFGLGPCAGDDFSGVANVATYAPWIAGVAGADLGGASCGALPPVGGPGAGVQGYEGALAGTGSEQVHAFDLAPGASLLRVALNGEEGGGADFDLAVRFGAPPEPGLNDCESRTASQFESCAFSSPASGTWYAQAQSFAGAGLYQVTATGFAAGAVCGNGLLEAGEACDDGNALPGDGCDALCQVEAPPGSCPAAPVPGCEELSAGGSKLKLKRGARPGKDRLRWDWRPKKIKGVPPATDDLADTDHHLCLYGAGGDLVFEALAPAGPGWSQNRKGLRFAGSGVPGTLDSLRVGTRSRITLKAKGREIPALPLAPGADVIAQLGNARGRCFEARYAAPAQRSDERVFSDRIKLR